MSSEVQSVVSLLVSCLAFLVSGVALGWTIYRDVMDMGRLTVRVQVARVVRGPDNSLISIRSKLYDEKVASGEIVDDGSKPELVATITNVGRRAIVVASWGGLLQRGGPKAGFKFIPRELPKTLQPGEFVMERTGDLRLLDGRARTFYAADSTDREWKVSRANLRQARADAREIRRTTTETKPGKGGRRE